MSGNRVALDTDRAIDVLDSRGEAEQWVRGLEVVHLPIPIVGESAQFAVALDSLRTLFVAVPDSWGNDA
ncbi:MAG: hypothetical protein FJ279_33735 [Planctomycetes bacterium]|nr:hypothetical protein [Planctomycetota bacterium]